MISYGVDYSIFSGDRDLDLTFAPISDPYTVIEQDIYKRLTCKQGIIDPKTGCFWDLNTMDIRDYILQVMQPHSLRILKTRLEALFFDELRFTVDISIGTRTGGELVIEFEVFPSTDLRPIRVIFTADSNEVRFEREMI